MAVEVRVQDVQGEMLDRLGPSVPTDRGRRWPCPWCGVPVGVELTPLARWRCGSCSRRGSRDDWPREAASSTADADRE